MKIVTQAEIEQRIQDKWPNEPFEIIEYTRMTKKFVIKCLTCGKATTYFNASNFLQYGEHLCECLGRDRNQVLKQANQDIILDILKQDGNKEFRGWGYNEKLRKNTVIVYCKKCKQIYEKVYQCFKITPSCPYCESHHDLNHTAFLQLVPEDYEALEEYQGTETKILFRHKCGFIRKISPHALLSNRVGCPRCSAKMSKGEQKIVDYLEGRSINYKKEATFEWSSNRRYRYDFYLPNHNTIIEYHGEQHYKRPPTTGWKMTLEEQQERDKIKQTEAEAQGINYFIIPYTDFHKINRILDKWFNDYSEKK